MRMLAAAAIVAGSIGLAVLIGLRERAADAPQPPVAAQIEGQTQFAADSATPIDKQSGRKPGRRGDDSCRWANDNECDDPDIGTGACRLGTDYSDCRALREGENDSCRWARDGECDEPNFGTGACVQGTDRTDCGDVAWMRNESDRCATAFNNVCEEPGRGNGRCEARTDRADCHGRERPMTINDHFFGRDDRVRVAAQETPWRFMGRFTNSAGEACTATLIGPNAIVTAAHCIHTDRGVAAAGTFRAEAGGEARAIAFLVSPRFNYRRFNTTDEIDGLDWALIRLDQPLGDRLGFAGVRNLTGQGREIARQAELAQAGYSWDTGDTLSGNRACRLVEVYRDNTFAHQCDTTRGDSGSAFLVRNGQGWDVIGVDSNYRVNPEFRRNRNAGPVINIAVSAASFQNVVGDFVAGRTGTAVAAGKPKG